MLQNELTPARVANTGAPQASLRQPQAAPAYEAPRVVFVGRAQDLLQGNGTARLDFGGSGWMRRY